MNNSKSTFSPPYIPSTILLNQNTVPVLQKNNNETTLKPLLIFHFVDILSLSILPLCWQSSSHLSELTKILPSSQNLHDLDETSNTIIMYLNYLYTFVDFKQPAERDNIIKYLCILTPMISLSLHDLYF